MGLRNATVTSRSVSQYCFASHTVVISGDVYVHYGRYENPNTI
jgi:hypothetical protein